MLLGIFFCCTIIGIPVGLACFALSGLPLAAVQKAAVREKVRYEFHEGAVAATHEGEVPWEV